MNRLLGDSDSALLAFTGACIRAGALAAHRKPCFMADSAVAIDSLQTLHGSLLFTTEVTLNENAFSCDDLSNLDELLFSELASADVRIHCCLLEDALGHGWAYAIDVGKRSFDALLIRDFSTENTCHILIEVVCLFLLVGMLVPLRVPLFGEGMIVRLDSPACRAGGGSYQRIALWQARIDNFSSENGASGAQ